MFAKRTDWNLAPNRLSEALAAHRSSGNPLLDLTLSNPTECGFSYDNPAILSALVRPSALEYKPQPLGLLCARQAVAKYYADLNHVVDPGEMLLTTGTSEAYSFIFRLLCDPDDEILVPAPGYPLFDFLADILDVHLLHYPLVYDHGWLIDFQALEKAVTPRTRAVIVVHPNNPTGHFCSPAQARQLSEFCASRFLAMIADEVFLDYSLPENRPASFVANSTVLTFTLSGVSKICGLPQMKVAWMLVNGPDRQKREALDRLEVIADSYLSMNTPIQLAVPPLLETRHSFQPQLINRIKGNLAELDRQLAEQRACARLRFEGGWNAVLRVPETQSDEELAVRLLTEKHVYVHPGNFYDFPRGGYLVISLIVPTDLFREGLSRLLACSLAS
jgi:aspartate/methionine/tyrosine aminotransferase